MPSTIIEENAKEQFDQAVEKMAAYVAQYIEHAFANGAKEVTLREVKAILRQKSGVAYLWPALWRLRDQKKILPFEGQPWAFYRPVAPIEVK